MNDSRILLPALLTAVAALPARAFASEPAAFASEPATFASTAAAVSTLVEATESGDLDMLLVIFGSDGKGLVESGDAKEDAEKRELFSRNARERLELVGDPANPAKLTLAIGSDSWPFPVPLVQNKIGRWFFDASQGEQEVLARRIGFNELTAIEVCRGYVEAQYEYAQKHLAKGVPEYAKRIVSTAGRQDGLYWESAEGAPECDVPAAFAKAAASMAPDKREPYFGYYFKQLDGQGPHAKGGELTYELGGAQIGGFAMVAWPAKYGVSGVQTFMVDHDGVVYEKHLGADTEKAVEAMTRFDPDPSWQPVKPEE